jgi:quinone-modifying oxidoreductase subunit QmoA
MNANAKPIMVVGGGVAGMTAALEAAEVGYRVILVEKEAYIGGRVVRTHRYFPKMCPPTCGFEINTRRIRQNPRISLYTLTTVENISGEAGNYVARLKKRPRYVTGKQPFDEALINQITSERSNDFNLGMDNTKALYLPHDMAYPPMYILDREALSDKDAELLSQACSADAIDLEMKEENINLEVGAVILATGWHPYDAAKLDNLGYGTYPDVITNVMMERLASPGGPTSGAIIRPSDGKKAENVAFVQCAGSRDEDHLPYCSAVCCMGSLKQIRYLREANENARGTMFYIDIRTIGREEKFYYDLLEDNMVSFVKGKVAKVYKDLPGDDLILDVQDTMTRDNLHEKFDLVVLATGVVPNEIGFQLPAGLEFDQYGFWDGTASVDGIYPVGCAKRPCDVSRSTKDATGAALKAIQCLNGGA